MIESDASFDNLIVWINSLTLSEKLSSIEEISTGVPIASALSILDKEYFNEQWSSKIFDEPINADSNWRLKVLALKKLLKSMIDYYEQLTGKSIADFLIVDVQAAAKDSNKQELFKILQLVVAIAINCPIRTTIIANISSFDENVQRSIMMAIQEIEGEKNKENSEHTLPQDQHDLIFEQEIQNLRVKIDELSQENEDYASKNVEFENQVSQLKDEVSSLVGEKSQLENKYVKLIAAQETGSEVPSKKINQLTKRLEETEEEIFRLEHARDELRAKTETLTLENRELQSRLGNSSQKDEECQKMKDELEELRLKNVEFKKLEALLETYKRKLDETNQMKNEMKILQDKNSVFMNCAIDLEEEKRRNASFRTQLEAYKRQLDELNENSQSGRLEKAESECRRLKEELNALINERQRSLDEKHTMRDFKDEMKLLEAAPEGKIESLESRLKSKDLELLTTEEKFKTALHAKEIEMRSIDERCKTVLQTKDQEMKNLEEKYRSYLAKAKTVITELENSQRMSNNNGASFSVVEFEGLRRELDEKDKIIQKLQEEQERMRIMKEQEDRLITTAFHGMAMQLHRDTMEKRLNGASCRTPVSFLARQRRIVNNRNEKEESQSTKSQIPPVNNQQKGSSSAFNLRKLSLNSHPRALLSLLISFSLIAFLISYAPILYESLKHWKTILFYNFEENSQVLRESTTTAANFLGICCPKPTTFWQDFLIACRATLLGLHN